LNLGGKINPDAKPRVDVVRDEERLGALDTEELAFSAF